MKLKTSHLIPDLHPSPFPGLKEKIFGFPLFLC